MLKKLNNKKGFTLMEMRSLSPSSLFWWPSPFPYSTAL